MLHMLEYNIHYTDLCQESINIDKRIQYQIEISPLQWGTSNRLIPSQIQYQQHNLPNQNEIKNYTRNKPTLANLT